MGWKLSNPIKSIENETFDVFVVDSDMSGRGSICFRMQDITKLVKMYESSSAIKVRLLLRKAQIACELVKALDDEVYKINDIIRAIIKSKQPVQFASTLQSIASL